MREENGHGPSLTGPCKHFFCVRVFGTVMLVAVGTWRGATRSAEHLGPLGGALSVPGARLGTRSHSGDFPAAGQEGVIGMAGTGGGRPSIYPTLLYTDAKAAIRQLTEAFGFTELSV